MRVRIVCGDCAPELGRFIHAYVGNVCRGIVAALRVEPPTESILLEVEGDAVSLQVDGRPVSLDENRGFAAVIVRDTVRGMTGRLKGIVPGAAIRIRVDLARGE